MAAQRKSLDSIVSRVDAVAANAQAFSERLPALGDKAQSLVASVDPEKLSRSIDNLDKFAAALGDSSENINQIVADARKVSVRFDALGQRAESLLTKLDSMAGQGPGGILEDATATLASIRAAADNFNKQIGTLGSNLNDFSGRGLGDLHNLVSEGQRTIGRLDRVISKLEQNPTGFLLGGENVPEYGGRRR